MNVLHKLNSWSYTIRHHKYQRKKKKYKKYPPNVFKKMYCILETKF